VLKPTQLSNIVIYQ